MVLHMPWDRRLGAPRVQLELAEHFRALGHDVDKFDLIDAYRGRSEGRVARRFRRDFSRHACDFVRRHGSRYDVIDAQHGDLPASKAALRFSGVLVARSSGLYKFYDDFERRALDRRLDAYNMDPARRLVSTVRRLRRASRCERSLRQADVINVINEDELTFVREELGLGDKAYLIPNGAPDARLAELAAVAERPEARLAEREVVFVGHWSPRKGSRDWGGIVQRVWDRAPDTRFSFLGTGKSEAEVLFDLARPASPLIRVIPEFSSDELPALLSRATVGALPSYIEGFGLGVLEQLAAGIPSVAYDVPGPRMMLTKVEGRWLVPAGDVGSIADAILRGLGLSVDEYARCSANARAVASEFRLSRIAAATLDAYRSGAP
jgi:glycosyltransferase involved in cell wall biosynthesis